MKLRFKLQTTPQVNQASSQKGDDQASRLAFVNIDNPTQIKERATQRRIRRHVMRDIGYSRRRGAVHPFNKCQNTTAVSISLSRCIPSYWGDVKVCINFKRLFWAMDMVSEGLLALAVADPAYEFRQRLDKGLDNAQHEQMPDQSRTLDELKQYTESLSLVRKSIIAPESRAGRYAIIGTIICLAVFDMRVRNYESWTMHMEGLQRIVQLGGGVEELDSCPALRQSLFLADVLGSLIDDSPPRFPLPRRASMLPIGVVWPKYAQEFLATLEISGSVSPLDKTPLVVIDGAMRSASQLAILLNQGWSANQMTLDLLIPVCNIAHDVLSLPSLTYKGPSTRRREPMSQIRSVCAAAELIRISVLSLLSTVITTTSGDSSYCATRRRGPVRQLLTQTEDGVWAGLEELKLWVLVIQTLMEAGPARLWFLDQITHAMSLLLLRSWDDLMSCIRQVIWIEKAAMQEVAQLKSDIERRLTA